MGGDGLIWGRSQGIADGKAYRDFGNDTLTYQETCSMSNPAIAPYGSWKSPITSDLIVAETIGVAATGFDDDDLYWQELRPKEGGRMTVVRHAADGAKTDLTPAPFNARTSVHEYGGGAYVVDKGAQRRPFIRSGFSTGRAAALPCFTSITAAALATAVPTVNGSTASGGWSMWTIA